MGDNREERGCAHTSSPPLLSSSPLLISSPLLSSPHTVLTAEECSSWTAREIQQQHSVRRSLLNGGFVFSSHLDRSYLSRDAHGEPVKTSQRRDGRDAQPAARTEDRAAWWVQLFIPQNKQQSHQFMRMSLVFGWFLWVWVSKSH